MSRFPSASQASAVVGNPCCADRERRRAPGLAVRLCSCAALIALGCASVGCTEMPKETGRTPRDPGSVGGAPITSTDGEPQAARGTRIGHREDYPTTPSRQLRPMEEKYGIEVTSVRLTALGGVVDFRYRVLDTERAAPLFERGVPAYLEDQTSGEVMAVPNSKVGPMRTTDPPKPGRIYFIFFVNPGFVKPGNLVTVKIGDFELTDLKVE